jgi:hypothetical protein
LEWVISIEDWNWKKLNASDKMPMEFYGSRSEGLWASSQDHGWGTLLTVFYSFGNQQDVSRFEEEFLVDKNEVRDSKVCVWVWHLSEGQSWPFETHQKPTALEHSWVEMGR